MRDSLALAEELLETLGRFRRQAQRGAPKPESLIELTGAQVEVVRLVRRRPGISVTEAAIDLGLAANTVSTLVGRLVDAGLITRSPDGGDRRIARLALTRRAAAQVEAWRDRREAAIATVLADLDPVDIDVLIAALPVLDRIGDQLDVAQPEPREVTSR